MNDIESHRRFVQASTLDGLAPGHVRDDTQSGPSIVGSSSYDSTDDEVQRDWRDKVKIFLGLAKADSPILSYDHKLKRTVRSVDEYHGYGKAAAFQACDPNFLIVRKYAWLRNYALLCLQDRLAERERDLEKLHGHIKDQDWQSLISRRRGDIKFKESKEILDDIVEMLEQYDKLLLRTSQVNRLERPTVRNQNSLYNLISNTDSQTLSEAEWIHNLDDLVAVIPDQERGPIEAFIEEFFRFVSRRLTLFLFRTRSQRLRSGNEDIDLVSHKRLNVIVSIFVTVIATALLLAPIAILYSMSNKGLPQIAVIFAFVLLFATLCALSTRATKQETFMATAAYAAVLVVFLGNNAGSSTG